MRFITALLLLLSTQSLAAECIQAPNRTEACPNMLYRLGQLPGMEKPAVLCICATDFKKFLTVPADKADAQLLQLKKMQLESELGQPIDPILAVLKSH
ncbi:hypothetical protein [Rheinheimera sp.]|uniref:hypothetical protein n=1 Tax=Rheinheimera sp. TaxID=1869214 RepID=UPI00307DBDDA